MCTHLNMHQTVYGQHSLKQKHSLSVKNSKHYTLLSKLLADNVGDTFGSKTRPTLLKQMTKSGKIRYT
jgi:hypothetical protein